MARLINAYIPADTPKLVSPFFGGGSVELVAAKRGIAVDGYDTFRPLIDFWRMAIRHPWALAQKVRRWLEIPMTKQRFLSLKKMNLQDASSDTRALVYYLLNRYSFGNFGYSGSFSAGKQITEYQLSRLESFRAPGVRVTCADFEYVLGYAFLGNCVIYADPPYANISRHMYGRNGSTSGAKFDHDLFFRLLLDHEKWILSYNDTQDIRRRFAGYHFERPQCEGYQCMKSRYDTAAREVLIFSDSLWRDIRDYPLEKFCEVPT